MSPHHTNAVLLNASKTTSPVVYFVKWKVLIVIDTKYTSAMYSEFHFVFCKKEATDCRRDKVHLSLYLVFHFLKRRLLIVIEIRYTSPCILNFIFVGPLQRVRPRNGILASLGI